MNPVRILLVDDQTLFREGLRTLLSVQEGFQVVGEAANGEEALRSVASLHPDVILMDLRMPVMNGVEATQQLRKTHPDIHVIVLTTFDDDEHVFDGLRAGAVGYLLKDAPSDKLFEAIRAASRGESFLQTSVASKVLAEFARLSQRSPSGAGPLPDPLSEREIEVLEWIARGESNREIADRLFIAEGTVKNHVSNILSKLDARDRLQAVIRARELGLL